MIQGMAHRVDDLIVLQGNIVLSLGSKRVIPARVTFENGEIGVVLATTLFRLQWIQFNLS